MDYFDPGARSKFSGLLIVLKLSWMSWEMICVVFVTTKTRIFFFVEILKEVKRDTEL